MTTVLKQPKASVSGLKITFKPFEVFYDGVRSSVDEAEVDLAPGGPGHWFYVQLVKFKDIGDYGYHLSEGAPGTGPVVSQDTGQISFIATVMTGNLNAEGTAVSEWHQTPVPPYLMQVP
jgi:hypothetical protein